MANAAEDPELILFPRPNIIARTEALLTDESTLTGDG